MSGTGDTGMRIIDEMARDPLVGSVLVLHGLHPDDLETRVAKAVERLQNKLRREGSQVDLLSIEDGAVSLRVTPPEHACASTSKTLRATVEDAVYSAAPDIAALNITGLEGKPASGFVAVELLGGQPAILVSGGLHHEVDERKNARHSAVELPIMS